MSGTASGHPQGIKPATQKPRGVPGLLVIVAMAVLSIGGAWLMLLADKDEDGREGRRNASREQLTWIYQSLAAEMKASGRGRFTDDPHSVLAASAHNWRDKLVHPSWPGQPGFTYMRDVDLASSAAQNGGDEWILLYENVPLKKRTVRPLIVTARGEVSEIGRDELERRLASQHLRVQSEKQPGLVIELDSKLTEVRDLKMLDRAPIKAIKE